MEVEIRKVENAEEEKAVIRTRRLTWNIHRVMQLLGEEEMTLTGMREGKPREIYASQIYYIETRLARTLIHTKNLVFETDLRIQDIEKRMNGDFLRCGKGRIVNVRKIQSVKNLGSLMLRATLLNEESIEMDRSCVPELKRILGL